MMQLFNFLGKDEQGKDADNLLGYEVVMDENDARIILKFQILFFTRF